MANRDDSTQTDPGSQPVVELTDETAGRGERGAPLTVADVVSRSKVFAGMRRDQVEYLASCGSFCRFPADAAILLQGQAAEHFYLLRSGSVVLRAYKLGRGKVPIETLRAGQALGWSWLFPPYRWQFDAVALEPVAAVAFDGSCLRGKSARDHEFGYQMMSRFAELMLQRLVATRAQLLDSAAGAIPE